MERRACDGFFEAMDKLRLAVTFGEVRLRAGYSEVEPANAVLESQFSRHVAVKTPIISAAMDTVTESAMAIALAMLGGLGVIHRNLSTKDQGEEIRRVKFHLSGLIRHPITIQETATMADVEAMREKRGFNFHSFPVLNTDNRLVGLLTQNDFDFCLDKRQVVSAVMTRDLISAPPGTTVTIAFDTLIKAKKKVLPLIDPATGLLVGMYLFSDLQRIISGTSSAYNVDDQGRLRVGAAVGVGDDALERAAELNGYADVLVIDAAHGDTLKVKETLKALKAQFPALDVVAGNISQGDAARRLVDWGADGVKVGQGPGSICTTRLVTGYGCPQVTAIYNVAKALRGTDVPICADGGIVHSGDIPVAIGAGAHTVMLGKLLAGTKEAPGIARLDLNPPRKYYRGMGSISALKESAGSRDRYRQTSARLVPEGVESWVPYVGELDMAIAPLIGGLRGGMGAVGAATISELRAKADFDRASPTGQREGQPHDVEVIGEQSTTRRKADD